MLYRNEAQLSIRAGCCLTFNTAAAQPLLAVGVLPHAVKIHHAVLYTESSEVLHTQWVF